MSFEHVERTHGGGAFRTTNIDLEAAKAEEDKIPTYTNTSLFFLGPDNAFRKHCIKIVYMKAFNNLIILLILANCGFMAYNDPLDTDPSSDRNQLLDMSEMVFTILFTIEMVLKIFAMGFCLDKGSYLRNGWNWLDFLVVLLGYLSLVPGVSNLSALRTFRVLRPLRTLSSIPGMRIIVKSMIASIPPLGGVALLSLFLFIIFGIIGLQLWGGVLAGRCFFNGEVDDGDFCALNGTDLLAFGRACGKKYVGTTLVQGVCRPYANPMHNLQSFDNIGFACLAIFTSITLEGWTDLMYQLIDTFGLPVLVVSYFILLVMFGSYFLLNLTMAVINDEYSKADAEQDAKDAAEKEAETARQALDAARNPTPEPETKNTEIVYCIDCGLTRACYHLVESPRFTAFITVLILGNTLCLSLEHYGQSEGFTTGLEFANLTFTVLFTGEMILKLIGLGPRLYVKDSFNTFDGIVVIISLVETGLTYLGPGDGGNTGLSALRTFRLMRVFKLARSWTNLRILLNTIVLSVMDVANASVLLAVIMFIFTLLGMQLFGGKMSAEQFGGEQPNANFDNLWWSFVTVFQVLTGENWNEVLYDGMHGAGIGVSVFYFMVLNIVGNYVILNLFLAILLRNFEGGDDDDEEAEDEGNGKYKVSPGSVVPVLNGPDAGGGGEVVVAAAVQETPKDEKKEEEVVEPGKLYGNSLFCLSPTNPLRVGVSQLVHFKQFDNFVLLLIGISSVLLAIDEPYIQDCSILPASDPENCITFQTIIATLDLVISMLFLAELVLKVIALGFIVGKGTYMRDGWNGLDFLIVAVSIVSLVMQGQKGVKALRSLRALRALKPLRVIKRNPGMKLVVNSIFRSLPAIGNVTVVCLLFFLIFGIVGVQNWSGAFNACNDPDIVFKANCTGTFTVSDDSCAMHPTEALELLCRSSVNGTEFPRVWAPRNNWSFDHVGFALLTLFEVTSGEMWPNIMYDTVAAVGKDMPMQRDYNQMVAVYYIAVIVVCTFLMLNVFVGVVIDNYNKMKEEGDGSGLLTSNQKLWVETMKLMLNSGPQRALIPPTNAIRAKIFSIVTVKSFELFIMGCIGLNSLVMACRYYPQPDSYATTLENMNLAFTILFAAEFLFKLFALGFAQYFRFGWNRFDCLLVILSFVGMIGNLGQFATLLRIFRVARIFRLVKFSRRLLELFKTLVYSIPSLANVGAILLLIFFMFAVMGMNLFAPIKLQENLNEHANFKSFWLSFLTLFRMSTGESFNAIMYDCMVQPPYCDPETNCGFPEFAPIFFCAFFILSNYMLLNLLIAIILDNFGDTVELSHATVTEEHIDMFKEQWAKQDLNADHWIPATGLKKLIIDLEFPLGLNNVPGVEHMESKEKQARMMIKELDIPVREGQINFTETLKRLASRAYSSSHGKESIVIPEQVFNPEHELKNKRSSSGSAPPHGDHSKAVSSSAEVEAAMSIQAVVRGKKERSELAARGIPVRTITPPGGPQQAPRNTQAAWEDGAESKTGVSQYEGGESASKSTGDDQIPGAVRDSVDSVANDVA